MALEVVIHGTAAVFSDVWISDEDAATLSKEEFCALFAEDPISFFEEFANTEGDTIDWQKVFMTLIQSVRPV
jgi:hypothetical protein